MREKGQPKFGFHFITLEETFKEVTFLRDKKKIYQAPDISVKTIKENRDLIAYFILHNFNNALSSSDYAVSLKYADKTDKTDMIKLIRLTIDP